MSRVRPDIVTVEMVLELMEKSDSKKQHMDPSLFGSRGAVFQHEFAICSGHSSGVRPTHSASFNHDLSEGGRETGEQSAPINPLLSLSLVPLLAHGHRSIARGHWQRRPNPNLPRSAIGHV